MITIAGYIEQGARTYMKRQYSVILIFVVVMSIVLLVVPSLGWKVMVCFISGALLSALAGYFGMRVAVKANVRTTQAAKEGVLAALRVAFSGGTVTGLLVVGFAALGLGTLYLCFDDINVLTGFSLGASAIALFCRVGGGIFTKAADVGADLVGKVEAGIPEDDPRNPAVIADNVGDNVGDVAGMGSDIFESYAGAVISSLLLGFVAFGEKGVLFAFLLAAIGIAASLIGIWIVRVVKAKNAHTPLRAGTFASAGLCIIGAGVLNYLMFGNLSLFFAMVMGIAVGVAIGQITEYYTSAAFGPVKRIAHQSTTGAATNILSGMAVGMRSTAGPILLIAAAVLVSFFTAGLFGVALAALGMLSTVGMIVAVDAYGPIADNAGGIAQMTHQKPEVRKVTDHLDAVGNTTAAIGKGFSIASAALTALALFTTYANKVDLSMVNVLEPKVIVGLLIGGMLPYLFSALTIEAVSKAAKKMIAEVRRQFREIDGVMEGTAVPEYSKCIDISTRAALTQMILPGILVIATPIAVGLLLGKTALAGLLVGATVTGVVIAIKMANSGGAWDNAKKHIEDGAHEGKNGKAHKASVIGDTVGDPLKDTAGPAINILIKIMSIVALVFAPLFM
jgi:K(+)-stimulated pyrophosphate-energized sodium pump